MPNYILIGSLKSRSLYGILLCCAAKRFRCHTVFLKKNVSVNLKCLYNFAVVGLPNMVDKPPVKKSPVLQARSIPITGTTLSPHQTLLMRQVLQPVSAVTKDRGRKAHLSPGIV